VCVCVYMCFVLFVHDGGNKLYLMRKETKITDIPGNVAHRALCLSLSLYPLSFGLIKGGGWCVFRGGYIIHRTCNEFTAY